MGNKEYIKETLELIKNRYQEPMTCTICDEPLSAEGEQVCWKCKEEANYDKVINNSKQD